VDTPAGTITYTLVRKRVKYLNLRLRRDGSVCLSVPYGCPDVRADQMIREKGVWILDALARQREQSAEPLPAQPRPVCQRWLEEAVDRVLPLVAPLGVARPTVKIRVMRSQWGNCHWQQGYITLNVALARCPEPLRDYVALHELVHFLHHDHGRGFYGVMDALMPDWRARRTELQRYGGALERLASGREA
jgi:predicted metal-dependent hydrolase